MQRVFAVIIWIYLVLSFVCALLVLANRFDYLELSEGANLVLSLIGIPWLLVAVIIAFVIVLFGAVHSLFT